MKGEWVTNRLPDKSGLYIIIKGGKEVVSYYSVILQQFDACEKKQPKMWKSINNEREVNNP